MEHWREVMPGKVLRIPYERLVQDPEAVVKGILEHCNMPWEPAVLDFHSNPRVVSTASLAQVHSQLVTELMLLWLHHRPGEALGLTEETNAQALC